MTAEYPNGLGLISKRLLQKIGDALRKKAGLTDQMKPADMPTFIEKMESGFNNSVTSTVGTNRFMAGMVAPDVTIEVKKGN